MLDGLCLEGLDFNLFLMGFKVTGSFFIIRGISILHVYVIDCTVLLSEAVLKREP